MPRWIIALLVTALFAIVAWAVGGVNAGGAAAGLAVAFALYYGLGAGAFGVLVAVFAITWAATRAGYSRKQRLGIAERRRGRRSAGQVLANLGIAGTCAVLAWLFRADWATLAAIAALAEAAADTASSECGEAWSDTAYLITGLRPVRAGTDGAISLAGSLAGIAATASIGAFAAALQVVSWPAAGLAALSGLLGTLLDSLLGATLERRGLLNNNAVNFLSTLAAALIAIAGQRSL